MNLSSLNNKLNDENSKRYSKISFERFQLVKPHNISKFNENPSINSVLECNSNNIKKQKPENQNKSTKYRIKRFL